MSATFTAPAAAMTKPDGLHTLERVNAAASAIRARWSESPVAAIILGTGLGRLAEQIEQPTAIPYTDIPDFPRSTVESHSGRLLCGRLGGRPVVAMQGRTHRYEGYSLQQVTFPVRVLRAIGAPVLIVSNACGTMRAEWKPGDLMALDDHINLLGDSPLVGGNDDRLGPRFPDMSQPYDAALRERAHVAAKKANVVLRDGVYAAITGPNLETRAEYRMLREIGADVVGMSTVPEVIVAVHSGMRVLGLSIITDMCVPETLTATTLVQIVAAANAAEPGLTAIVADVVAGL
jgi:purine-nucleoside phosphorylase